MLTMKLARKSLCGSTRFEVSLYRWQCSEIRLDSIIDIKAFDGVRIPVKVDTTWRSGDRSRAWCKTIFADVHCNVESKQINMSVT
ncbi:MAG: hypothetical protein PF489_11945 [Salinivirgaceae bacterium]|nr:hypothetical protein [Salinivirgaceae bacterium]